MSPIVAKTLMGIVRLSMPPNVVNHVIELVTTASSLNISGEEKRAQVKQALAVIQGDLQTALSGMSKNAVNLLIEVAVGYVNAKLGAVK